MAWKRGKDFPGNKADNQEASGQYREVVVSKEAGWTGGPENKQLSGPKYPAESRDNCFYIDKETI